MWCKLLISVLLHYKCIRSNVNMVYTAALYLFHILSQYSPILVIFIRETLLRSGHKWVAA